MRIGIDLRCLSGGNKSGVEEYALNFLKSVLEADGKNEYLIFTNSFRSGSALREEFKSFPNVSIREFRIPNKLLNFLFWYLHWPRIDQLLGGTDILFLPNINFAAWSRRTKAIVTFHDLSFELYPETFSWKRRLWHFFVNPRKLAREADRIIAVSESTRDDLLDYFHIPFSKIRVIPSGISDRFRLLDRNDLAMAEVMKRYQLPYRFILFLGTIEPRKNIGALVRAFGLLRATPDPEIEKYKLVVAGATGWKARKVLSEITESPFKEEILMVGMIDEADMPAVYNLAAVFVYPSLFEGFGFPPLEAMKCGTPTIVSNASSLPETSGEAALMVDPDKPEEIATVLRELILNRELREERSKAGILQAKKFRWESAARSFLELIEKV